MYDVRSINDPYDEGIELLGVQDRSLQDRSGQPKDTADSDIMTIESVALRTESYQSTCRLIVYAFATITVLLMIFACAAFGSSIASSRKAQYHVNGTMPSVVMASGECDTLKYVNLTLVLLINCVGTVIIGCSNYLQQGKLKLRPC